MADYFSYLAKYGKTYAKPELEERFEIYKKNAILVSEQNEKDAGFTLELNMFADMTNEEVLRNTGAIVPPERSEMMKDFSFNHRARKLSDSGPDTSNFPNHLDWYKRGKVNRP